MVDPTRPQSLAGIKDGVLHVQVDLLAPNADIKAHGFLGKAAFLVEDFFAEQALANQIQEQKIAIGNAGVINEALKGKL